MYENQGCVGVDRQTLAAFAEHLHKNLKTLRDEVLYETYQPLPLLRVDLENRAAANDPYRFHACATGCCKLPSPALLNRCLKPNLKIAAQGAQCQQAVNRSQCLQRQGYQWVVDADIQHFFDSIDHTLLMLEVDHRDRWRPAVCAGIRYAYCNEENFRHKKRTGQNAEVLILS